MTMNNSFALDENIFYARNKMNDVIQSRADKIAKLFIQVNKEQRLFIEDLSSLSNNYDTELDIKNDKVILHISDYMYAYIIDDFPKNLAINGSDQELIDYFLQYNEETIKQNKINRLYSTYNYVFSLDYDILKEIISREKPKNKSEAVDLLLTIHGLDDLK